MKIYPESYNVDFIVPYKDKDGQAFVPTAVTATLWDGDDVLLETFDPIVFDDAAESVTITVPSALNTLGVGQLSEVRVLRITFDTAAGKIRLPISYIIEGEARLEVMNNTFVTLASADALARDIPNLTGWSTGNEETKSAALINAYARLTRIMMRFTVEDPDLADYKEDKILNHAAWAETTRDEFMLFPKRFRDSLRMAQLVEANSILTDNPIEQRHRAGVISESVGESTIMLRSGRLDLGISSESLRYLTGYVYYNVRIGRA